EAFADAGEQGLFGEVLEARVGHGGGVEVAGGLGVGGGQEVGDEVGVVAEDFGQGDAAGAGGLEGLVVDGVEDGAEQAGGDEVVQELGELLGVAVLDDPEKDGGAQVLLDLPGFEGGGGFGGVAVRVQAADALGGELALGGLEAVADDGAVLALVVLIDESVQAALEWNGELCDDVGDV